MNSDATEAALGLLGLSPLNAPQSHPQPQPHPHHHVAHAHGPSLTSSSVGIAVDRTSAPHVVQSALPPSLVPLKRKQPSPALSAAPTTPPPLSTSRDALSTKLRQPSHPLATSSTPPTASTHPLPNLLTKSLLPPPQRHPQQRPFSPILSSFVSPQTPPTSQLSLASPSVSQRLPALSGVPPPPDSDAISCICGFTYDDGFSIACDDCSRWCHAACFGIVQGGEVPEFWKCWVCDPTVEVDKERAVKTQKGRLKAMRMKASYGANGAAPGAPSINGIGGNQSVDEGSGGTGKPASKRKTSPGAERKSRRGSAVAAAIEGSGSSRKKRRALVLPPADPLSPSTQSSNHSAQLPAGSSRISNPNGSGLAASSSLPPTPVTFPPDIYPNPSIHAQLLRVAKAWRGVTALNPPSPLLHPPPRTYNDGGYTRVDSQGYRDRYGYSLSPLDNTTPVILDENVGGIRVPRTVLRTDSSASCPNIHSGSPTQYPYPPTSTTYSPTHLRPPSPSLHIASNPSLFPHSSIYPSPPISNYMSPPVPSPSHSRSYARSPLTPSTNTISSSNPNNTIPATTLLAPYTAAIIPSAAYLADPLNGYAHLGMGKPQVRLVGGGWGVGLDARGVEGVPDLLNSGEKGSGVGAGKEDVVEGKAKWARCGCWPNAVVRPIICGGTKGEQNRKGTQMRHGAECAKGAPDGNTVSEDGVPPRRVNGRSVPPSMSRMQEQQTDDSSDQDDVSSASDSDADPTTLSFALFALRDLRADEEIVLGWEWDDGHAVHMLPALMECPGMFAPAHLHHLRAQFTSILHALSSTFTTCACGSSTRDCAVRVMERVVEGRWPWPSGEVTSEGSEGDFDVDGVSEECDDCGEDVDVEGDGPTRPSRNCGLGMDVDMDKDASVEVNVRTRRVKKRKVRKKSKAEDAKHVNGTKDASVAESGLGSMVKLKVKKAVDLGPLVGVKRGFRTREKEPTNGGWGGVEIVPSSLKPFPEVRSKDVDVEVDGKGKGKTRVTDGATDDDDDDDMHIDPSPSTLPPRMRLALSRPSTSQPETSQDHPRSHPRPVEGVQAYERWRSPSDLSGKNSMSVSGVVEGSSRKRDGPYQGLVSINGGEGSADGQETEFDTETEADGSDDTRQMPPPPMPASLDPTTVSSLVHAHAVRSLSPRGSIPRDRNGLPVTWMPPRTPTPTSASSGQSGQPPDQGPSCTPTLVPPRSAPTRSPTPSQGNHDAPSHSPSSPFATQVPVQSHPPSLVSSVSPSPTFSKLSLHSPDASSSSHLSVLLSPGASTLPSSTSALTQPTSDGRSPSPPAHTPSKPLHVHPQNELPSLSTSLPLPVVPSGPCDVTRDTPAEAQYQQTYQSPPESHQETYSSDAEKSHPINGLLQLQGKMTLDSSESRDVDGSTSTNASANRVANEQVVLPPNGDVMDVDQVAVIGDNQQGNNPSHAVSSETRVDSVSENERPSLGVPGSPHPEAPPDSLPCSIAAAMDSTETGSDSVPVAPDASEMSQAEPMAVDLEAVSPLRDPSPPPAPKVKMSLKDFALRKKKQREEEMAAKALHSPATPGDPVLPSSPTFANGKRDLLGDRAAGVVSSVDVGTRDHGVKIDVVTKVDAPDSSRATCDGENGLDGLDSGPLENVKAEDDALPAVTHAPNTTLSPSSPLSRSQATLSRIPGEKCNTDQTRTQINGKPTTTLAAKMEVVDVVIPSGLVGADDRMTDVVSFAPEPPPPPLTTKQASELMAVDRTVLIDSAPRSVPPATPAYVSTSASVSTSTSTSTVNSRSNSVGVPASTPSPSVPVLAQVPTSSSIPPSRRPSHEDGEITSSTPPKSYLPHSHTPPTQPRSFNAAHPLSPNFGPTSSSTVPVPRRPAPPLSRSPLSNAAGPTPAPISSRPLPSGPRALRGSMAQPTHPPSYAPGRPSYASSQYIPRGPSADRDRIDWERSDRQWAAPARSRGRAGSNGWGR